MIDMNQDVVPAQDNEKFVLIFPFVRWVVIKH